MSTYMGRIILKHLPNASNGRWVELRKLPNPSMESVGISASAASEQVDASWLQREVRARRNLGFVYDKLVVFGSIPPCRAELATAS